MPGKRELNKKTIEKPIETGGEGMAMSNAESAAAARLEKSGLLLLPAIAALVLLLACVGWCAYAATRDTIAPNTVVGGTEVGGLTREEAAERIGAALDELRRNSGVHAVLDDGTEAAYLSYEALGVTFDAATLANDAYDHSHSGNPIADGWERLRAALGKHAEVTPLPDADWTGNAARLLADAAYRAPVDFSYTLDEAYRLTLTRERDGRAVDVDALRARLDDAAADESGSRTVVLPCTAVPARGGDLNAINEQYGGEMANARYDAQTQTILPERMAVNFDVAEARRLLDAAEPGARVEVPTVVTEPEVTAEELAKVLFRDVLGTYTTRVGGAAGRKSNVKLTASRVNGTILNSGDEFNYYKLTGPFSAANGYLPAPGYLHGKTVDMDGGGACQCCSTSYAAALMANLEIVTRTAHGFASDYIGLGLDATVSGGGPDMIFRNNTPYPIKVVAEYSSSNRLTVSILGTKTDDITVKMRVDVLSTTPYEEEIVEDPTLAPGERVVDTTPYTGYTVNTYRQLYDGEGNLISETFEAFSRYNKRNRIIHVGPSATETPVTPPAAEEPPATPPEPVTPDEPPVVTPDPVETPPAPDTGGEAP